MLVSNMVLVNSIFKEKKCPCNKDGYVYIYIYTVVDFLWGTVTSKDMARPKHLRNQVWKGILHWCSAAIVRRRDGTRVAFLGYPWMLCDLGSVGDTTKADFFLGELFDFPGGGLS